MERDKLKNNKNDYSYKDDGKYFDDNLESSDEYEEFVEKFKPKKTTDDCYTPAAVYEAIKKWAIEKYDIKNANIMRPFKPGGGTIKKKNMTATL